ncbi:hypothetical protein BKA67DRAFT_281113 [Truncatella angustata]|uniref:Secreted protein n=1 Tax=Truncatella angustata TaxID=152316 RepID=A0A9P8UM44_9PEZI|nr:uncharacterized protein BKA67DRAFT_281113 [Truncatella angustata]KAH6654502.1 hypothetical protein BKA67DRAFT_281113 [Truncatella angustata]
MALWVCFAIFIVVIKGASANFTVSDKTRDQMHGIVLEQYPAQIIHAFNQLFRVDESMLIWGVCYGEKRGRKGLAMCTLRKENLKPPPPDLVECNMIMFSLGHLLVLLSFILRDLLCNLSALRGRSRKNLSSTCFPLTHST